MRVFFIASFALFPILVGAQDLTYQITSGSISGDSVGAVSGGGFTGGLYAAPELLSYPEETLFQGGSPQLSFCFGCGLPGTDDGVGTLTATGLNNPALAGLVQVFGEEGYLESGALTVSPTIDVTGAGTYTAAFTLSAQLDFGAPGASKPSEYVDFAGNGTVALDVAPTACSNCGPLQIESVVYTFAPELDPASLGGALTLLGGGLLVIRGRRSRA